MPYLLLIMEGPDRRAGRAPEVARLEYERMMRFAEGLTARGICSASQALRPLAEGVRIAVRGGQRVVADGPFAEAKEMVGGFFLLDCKSKAEAVAIAAECPAIEWATVEVRQIGACNES